MMHKLDDLPRPRGNATPDDPHSEWGKDTLIAALEAQGLRPISVDRTLLVIEQCEPGDDFPAGRSADPLRLTIHPDPDADPVRGPDYVYIHAGRFGLMDIVVCREKQDGTYATDRCVYLDSERVEALRNSNTLVETETVLKICREYLTGCFEVCAGPDAAMTEHDEELEKLGQAAVAAVERYMEKLQTMPNLFHGWDRDGQG